MRTIEIEIDYPNPDRPPDRDWIPEDELAATVAEIKAAGLTVRILGSVSWQRQLARMENNPEH